MLNMFKKIWLASAFVGILLTSTTANATLIVDTIDQEVGVGWWDSYSYTHDLTDDGFIPGTTMATSGTIEIQFSDDYDWWLENIFPWEIILIVVDDFDFDTGGVLGSASSFVNEIEVNALAQINADGMLDITIESLWGDFYVGQSVLSVYTTNTSDAPAPPVLGILLIGLLSMSAAGRMRKTCITPEPTD